jgi:hypothetical protein
MGYKEVSRVEESLRSYCETLVEEYETEIKERPTLALPRNSLVALPLR